MNDRSRVALAVLVGAGLGGAIGYLYLTDAGRRVRQQIEPRIDDVVTEIRRWQRIVDKARAASNEALRALDEMASEPSPRPWESVRSIR